MIDDASQPKTCSVQFESTAFRHVEVEVWMETCGWVCSNLYGGRSVCGRQALLPGHEETVNRVASNSIYRQGTGFKVGSTAPQGPAEIVILARQLSFSSSSSNSMLH